MAGRRKFACLLGLLFYKPLPNFGGKLEFLKLLPKIDTSQILYESRCLDMHLPLK